MKTDNRWVYLAVFLSELLPLIRPCTSITVVPTTPDIRLVESLEEEPRVPIPITPRLRRRNPPQLNAVTQHLLSRGAKIVWVNLTVKDMYAERVMDQYTEQYGYNMEKTMTCFRLSQKCRPQSHRLPRLPKAVPEDATARLWGPRVTKGVRSMRTSPLDDINTGDHNILPPAAAGTGAKLYRARPG
jgi:hypothetical protein